MTVRVLRSDISKILKQTQLQERQSQEANELEDALHQGLAEKFPTVSDTRVERISFLTALLPMERRRPSRPHTKNGPLKDFSNAPRSGRRRFTSCSSVSNQLNQLSLRLPSLRAQGSLIRPASVPPDVHLNQPLFSLSVFRFAAQEDAQLINLKETKGLS